MAYSIEANEHIYLGLLVDAHDGIARNTKEPRHKLVFALHLFVKKLMIYHSCAAFGVTVAQKICLSDHMLQ